MDLRMEGGEWKYRLLHWGKLGYHIELLFGWNISVLNAIFGGILGNSSGKVRLAS